MTRSPHSRPTRHPPPASWREVLARIERGTVLVVGAPGVGKTALVGYLAGQLDRALPSVAWIDADPGQPGLGPPACLGLALTGPWRAPQALWLAAGTGLESSSRSATSETPPTLEPPETGAPAADPLGLDRLELVAGAGRLARRARDHGAAVVLVDAPGVLLDPVADSTGRAGRRLLRALALAVEADQVVAVEAGGVDGAPGADPALEQALAALAERDTVVHRLPAPTGAVATSAAERRRGLDERLAAHLAEARPLELPRRRLLDRELVSGGGAGVEPGTVVGLLDGDGFCLALGVVETLGLGLVTIHTPWRDRPAVARARVTALAAERARDAAADSPQAGLWRLVVVE